MPGQEIASYPNQKFVYPAVSHNRASPSAKKGDSAMIIAKRQVLDMIKDLPEQIDVDELIYRLYLRQKLEAAEKDVREGRLVSHEEVVKETSKWFK